MADGKIVIDVNLINNANKTLSQLKNQFKGLAVSGMSSLTDLGGKLTNLGSTMITSGAKVAAFGSAVSGWGRSSATGKLAVAGLAAGVGLLTLGTKGAIDRMDTMRSATLTMTKGLGMSKAEANAYTSDLRSMAMGTQYTTGSLAKMAAGLMSSGMSATETKKTIAALTDTVAGLGGGQTEIDTFTAQLQRTASVGKVTTQDLDVMTGSVTGLRTEMTKKFYNGDGARFQADLEAGNITAEMVSATVQDMGVRFKGAAKESLGFAGTFKVMKDRVAAGMEGILEAVGGGKGAPKIMELLTKAADGISKGFKDITPKIVKFVDVFKKIWPYIKPLVVGLAGFVTAMVAVKAGAIILGPVISGLGTTIKIVGLAFKGFGKLFNSGPVGIFIAIIGVLVAALVVFFTKTKEGKKIWQEIVDFFKANVMPIIKEVGDKLMKAWQDAQPALQQLWETIQQVWNQISPFIMQVIQDTVSFINDHWTDIQKIISDVMNAIDIIIQTGMTIWQEYIWPAILGIVDFIKAHWTDIQNIIQGVIEIVGLIIEVGMALWSEYIWPIIQGIVDFITENWTTIQNVISSVIEIVGVIIAVGMALWNTVIWPVILGIVTFISDNWNSIMSIISGAIKIIQGVLNVVMGIIKGDWGRVWEGIKQLVSGVWNVIKGAVNIAINVIKNAITSTMNAIKAVWSAVWNTIKGVATSVWNTIGNFIKGAINTVRGAIQNGINRIAHIWSGIKNLATTAWNAFTDVVNKVRTGIQNAVNAVKDKVNSMLSAGKNFVMGFVDGIVGAVGDAVNAAANMAKKALKAAKKALGIASPSREMAEVGMFTALGMAKGIDNNADRVENAMTNLADGAIHAIQDAGIADAVDSAFDVSPTLSGLANGTITAESVIRAQAGTNNAAVTNSAVNTANTVNNNFAAGAFVVRNDNDIQKISEQLAWHNTKSQRGGLAFG